MWFCRYFTRVQRRYLWKIIFFNCSEENCNLCQDKIYRDEYNEQRWATDRDGYLVCRTCYEKLGADNEICEKIFYISCYAASYEFCDSVLPKE